MFGILNAVETKYKLLSAIKQAKEEKTTSKSNLSDKSMTVDEGIKKFFSYREQLVREDSLEFTTYEDDLIVYGGRYIRDNKILSTKIIDVDTDFAKDYTKELWSLRNITQAKEGQELSINTIYKPFAFLRKVFETDLGLIESNPFSDVENAPSYTPKAQEYLIDKEIQIVIDNLPRKNIRFQCFMNLLLETGLRIEEILAIRWKDINHLRESINIEHALRKSKLSGKFIVKSTKTKSSEREVCFNYYTLDLMNKYHTFKEMCGIVVSEDDFIFTSWDSNEPINIKQYADEWRKFSNDLGITRVPLKNIRHTNATFMLKDNPNKKAVQKRLGHAKITTTEAIYDQAGNYYDNKELSDKFANEFRNAFGLSIAELYMVSVNRLVDKRKLHRFLESISGILIDDNNFNIILEKCQQQLFKLYPVFSKIAEIDDKLSEQEIIALFEGFKSLYSNIKPEVLL